MPIDEEKRQTLRTLGAVGATGPLLGLTESGEENDTRERLQTYIARAPGAHFSKIRDDCSLATGETQYHLRLLRDGERIEVVYDGDYKRCFPARTFDEFEKRALGQLRRETTRRTIIVLLADPSATGAAIADRLDVSEATVSKVLSALESADLLDRDDKRRLRRPETLLTLLIQYADSFDAETVRFARNAEELIRYDRF